MSADGGVRDDKRAAGVVLHAVRRASSREGQGEGWEEERKGRHEGGGGRRGHRERARERGDSGRRHEARGFGRAGRGRSCDHGQTTS